MGRRREPTRRWSSTYTVSLRIHRTIGWTSCPGLNSLTIPYGMNPLKIHHSPSTLGSIHPDSPSTPHPPMFQRLMNGSYPYKDPGEESRRTLRWPSLDRNVRPIATAVGLLNLNLGTRYGFLRKTFDSKCLPSS
ncbi:hypothetical protein FKM82_028765 [Ascaphus truei]